MRIGCCIRWKIEQRNIEWLLEWRWPGLRCIVASGTATHCRYSERSDCRLIADTHARRTLHIDLFNHNHSIHDIENIDMEDCITSHYYFKQLCLLSVKMINSGGTSHHSKYSFLVVVLRTLKLNNKKNRPISSNFNCNSEIPIWYRAARSIDTYNLHDNKRSHLESQWNQIRDWCTRWVEKKTEQDFFSNFI